MPKSRTKRRGKRPVVRAPKVEREQLFRSPFADIPPDALRQAIEAMSRDRAEQFPAQLDSIIERLRACDVIQVVATIGIYGLQHGVGAEGVRGETQLQQHHVELLQALSLSIPPEELQGRPATPEDIQFFMDALPALAESFHLRRINEAQADADTERKITLSLQEAIRLHTQVVRNWGYFSQVGELSQDLYGPLDARFVEKAGFSPSDLIMFGRWAVKIHETRLNERLRKLRKVVRQRTPRRMVDAFFKVFPNAPGTADEVLAGMPPGAPLEGLMGFLMGVADLDIATQVEVHVDEVVTATGIPLERVQAMVGALALPLGAAAGERTHLFLSNPIWAAPIILRDGKWFLPGPQFIFSHVHEIIRSLAAKVGLELAVTVRRAAFLEERLMSLFTRALPGAKVASAVKWTWDGQGYESDFIAVLDRIVVIGEGKSAALTGPALRGAPDRMKRHIRELVVDPSIQSDRLEGVLRRATAGDADAQAALPPILQGVRLDRHRSVIRVSVTLDDFSVLSSSERELKEVGWAPADLRLAPTMNIADLASLVEILDRPALLLHYLSERERIQKSVDMVGDELDMLGFYLSTGFNLLGAEKEVDQFMISGASRTIDHYFESRDAGVRTPKPKPRLVPVFDKLIAGLEASRPPGWADMALDLLRLLSFEEQKALFKGLEELRRSVPRNWSDPKHPCGAIVRPPAERDTCAVFFVYPPQLESERRHRLKLFVQDALADTDYQRCVAVSLSTAHWDLPYAHIAMVQLAPPGNEA